MTPLLARDSLEGLLLNRLFPRGVVIVSVPAGTQMKAEDGTLHTVTDTNAVAEASGRNIYVTPRTYETLKRVVPEQQLEMRL